MSEARVELALAHGSVRAALRLPMIRCLTLASGTLGWSYLTWRVANSVNWDTWFIAVPLILAEFSSYVDAVLFGLTMWRLRERRRAPPAPAGVTVDVLITCYDEPADLVRQTARAALA